MSCAEPRDAAGRRVGRRKIYVGLHEYILRHLGRVPIPSVAVYKRVCDDYGHVNRRVFWRYLKQMADARKIQRIIEESQYPNNATHLYRLPQRRRETVQHRNRI